MNSSHPISKPLPPHLRPSLAFPSSAVLAQSQYLLQQQQLGNSATTLRDTKTTTNNSTTRIVNDINAESINHSSIPLPERFTDATYYSDRPTHTNQHPLYRTSNHQYGTRAPSQAELPKSYYPTQHKFTAQFAAGFNTSHTSTKMQH